MHAAQAVIWDRPELLALRDGPAVAYDVAAPTLLAGGSRFAFDSVAVELAVPGEELVISHEPSLRARLLGEEVPRIDKSAEVDAERKNAERAVRDAFRKAARRLQAYVRRKSGV